MVRPEEECPLFGDFDEKAKECAACSLVFPKYAEICKEKSKVCVRGFKYDPASNDCMECEENYPHKSKLCKARVLKVRGVNKEVAPVSEKEKVRDRSKASKGRKVIKKNTLAGKIDLIFLNRMVSIEEALEKVKASGDQSLIRLYGTRAGILGLLRYRMSAGWKVERDGDKYGIMDPEVVVE